MNILIKLASVGLIHGDFNEFNIMVSDEQAIKIIDFPQMISTSHYNAETLFNRDRNCIETFFKRRFAFEAREALPSLKEIEKRSNLDADVEASGYTAEMREECDAFLDLTVANHDFDDNIEEELESDSKSKSSSDEESDNKSSSCEENGSQECDIGLQKPSTEVNVSEKRQHKDSGEHGNVDRKSKFENLIDIEVEDKADSQKLLEEELIQNFENLYSDPKLQERDLMARLRLGIHTTSIGGRSTATSSAYVSTTIPPDMITQRLKKQRAKQTMKENCHRAVRQGEASLKTRKKDNVRDDIKTSLSAVWY